MMSKTNGYVETKIDGVEIILDDAASTDERGVLHARKLRHVILEFIAQDGLEKRC